MLKKSLWFLFALFAIIVGLYPAVYFVLDRKFGLLSSKSDELLSLLSWNIGFYIHIILGGLALLIGWTQFIPSIRRNHLKVHRTIGKTYITAVLLSAIAAIYIGFYATGGWVSSLGFICLGITWFSTTLRAYLFIRKRQIQKHQQWMIFSYAACFAAVTLRIWLLILMILIRDSIAAYTIVAWLCWVPNIFVAYLITRRMMITDKPTIAIP